MNLLKIMKRKKKDNGNSFLIVWEESYQKEEYWIGVGGISMN